MRSVLDAPSQRQIKIIEFLTSSDGWVTIGNLAKSLGVATKTINEDISIIRESWGEELNIESSFVYGIRINQASSSILLMIFSDIFNESLSVKWIELVFYTPYKDIKYYAELLHVSQSTLYRLRTKINVFFDKYGISLNSHQSLYYFTADNEIVYRKIMTTILTEVSGVFLLEMIGENILTNLQKRTNQDVLKKYVDKHNLYIYYFTVFYYVSLVRENQGFNVEKRPTSEFKGKPPSSNYLLFLISHFPRLKEEQINNIESDIIFHLEGWENTEQKESVNKMINQFVNELFEFLGLLYTIEQFKIFEGVLNTLYLEQTNFGVPFSKLFNRFAYFSVKIQKEKPSLYKYLVSQFTNLSTELGVDFITYIDIIIYCLVTTIPEVVLYNKAQKILVVSDFSEKHAKFIVERLSYSVSTKQYSSILFDHTTKDKLSQINLRDYQFIVSNCLVNDDCVDIILIDDYPTYKDISRVNYQINLFFQ